MAVQVSRHVEPKASALGVLGSGRERRPTIEDRLRRITAEREEVIEEPEVIEAGRIGRAPTLSLHVDRMDLLIELQPESKRECHCAGA
jgi:hypothetical protein